MCGFWGLLATGLFAIKEYSYNDSCGAFYGCHETFVANLMGALTIVSWTSVIMIAVFKVLEKSKMLRIPLDMEEVGIDVSKHSNHI